MKRIHWSGPAAVLLAMMLLLIFSSEGLSQSTRVKDLVNIKGVRSNDLLGMGLIIGLSGTGDSANSLVTNKAYSHLMRRMGINLDDAAGSNNNVAAVVVTATLPPFARIGDRLDIKVSAVGDASSLAGGVLLKTPLMAGDQSVYAVAQGSIVTGQAGGSGTGVLTVARVINGGTVEREFIPMLGNQGHLTLSLKRVDFTTNSRVVEVLNDHFKDWVAKSLDPGTIQVTMPKSYEGRIIDFVADFERLRVDVDTKARVVINERTGTVVMGSEVMIGRLAVSHGNLSIEVNQGEQSASKSIVETSGSTVGELVQSLNELGVSAKDLIEILQGIHAAGALQADLEIL